MQNEARREIFLGGGGSHTIEKIAGKGGGLAKWKWVGEEGGLRIISFPLPTCFKEIALTYCGLWNHWYFVF